MAKKSLTDVPETTHEAMQATATNRVADLDSAPDHEPIPGEYDQTTATHRQPGAIGGRFNGGDAAPEGIEQTMDDRIALDHAYEGGGVEGGHRFKKEREEQ
jgi:hypothetical protein